jgi:protein involved in polysaccharide export with SLBB domain
MKTIFIALLAATLAVAVARADAPLRAGDTFELRIGGVPAEEMSAVNGTYTIDGGGGLNLPYIGKLNAGNMTANQIQSMVERMYVDKGIYSHPTITLTVPLTGRFVNVGGAVRQPQRVAYTPDMTVLTAINAAGDFNEFADRKRVRLTSGQTTKIINCNEIAKNPALDVPVLPGDQITVKEGFW